MLIKFLTWLIGDEKMARSFLSIVGIPVFAMLPFVIVLGVLVGAVACK